MNGKKKISKYGASNTFLYKMIEGITKLIKKSEGAESIAHAYGKSYGEYSAAFNASRSGCRGYHYKAIDFTNKKIYLCADETIPVKTTDGIDYEDSDFVIEEYQVGDRILVQYNNLGTFTKSENEIYIEQIEHNVITYSGDLAGYKDLEVDTTLTADYAFVVYDIEHPTAGLIDIGLYAFSVNRGYAIGQYSFASGRLSKAVGKHSFATGESTRAIEQSSFAEGEYTEALNIAAHAEGYSTTASGAGSHAEGHATTASGMCSHAEGETTKASNYWSHSEGKKTTASGVGSHAEGSSTTASGEYSHSEGSGTTANGLNQHVQGKFNIVGSAYADIVGNGKSDTERSNAYTLDWEGNGRFAGDVYVGGTQKDDENLKKLATEEYVTNVIAEMQAKIDALEAMINSN